MRCLLVCCLLLLTACAGGSTPPTATPRAVVSQAAIATMTQVVTVAVVATATRVTSPGGVRPCPDGLPVKVVGAEDGSLRAVVPGDADYERAVWLRCFATVEEAGAAGFVRSATGGTPRAQPGAALLGEDTAVVVRVLDAFTIEVRLGDGRAEVVRYLGVDTPGKCDGAAGSAYNTTLVAGRTVRLEKDVSERDRFERLLRYVWVTGDDGVLRLANAEVVRVGQAAVALQPPDVKYAQHLRDAEREAYGAGLGLWASCAAHLVPPVTPTPTPEPPTPTATPQPPTALPAPPALPTAVPPTPKPAAPPTATAPPVVHTATQRAATATRVPPTATRPPVVVPTATRASACHPSYPTLCLPGSPDLDCKDIPQKNFPVLPPDPHGFDADKDGIGCET